MPFYQYFCEENNKTIEVSHSISQRLRTWGEVCACAGIDPEQTPADACVTRLIGKPMTPSWRLKGLDKDAPSHRLQL